MDNDSCLVCEGSCNDFDLTNTEWQAQAFFSEMCLLQEFPRGGGEVGVSLLTFYIVCV